MYVIEGLSIRKISDLTGCAKSTVGEYLAQFGIDQRVYPVPAQRRGQIPFGSRMHKGHMIAHKGEQKVIEELLKMRAQSRSFGDIVVWLNLNKVKSKNGGKWDRPTVYKIIKRCEVATT